MRGETFMKRILVIAESALLRKVLKIVLEEEGYSVDLARSTSLIPPCQGEDFPLVIVDGQHGEEADDVVNAMRTHGANLKAVTLLYSGFHQSLSPPHAILSKPLDLLALKQHVTAVFACDG